MTAEVEKRPNAKFSTKFGAKLGLSQRKLEGYLTIFDSLSPCDMPDNVSNHRHCLRLSIECPMTPV